MTNSRDPEVIAHVGEILDTVLTMCDMAEKTPPRCFRRGLSVMFDLGDESVDDLRGKSFGFALLRCLLGMPLEASDDVFTGSVEMVPREGGGADYRVLKIDADVIEAKLKACGSRRLCVLTDEETFEGVCNVPVTILAPCGASILRAAGWMPVRPPMGWCASGASGSALVIKASAGDPMADNPHARTVMTQNKNKIRDFTLSDKALQQLEKTIADKTRRVVDARLEITGRNSRVTTSKVVITNGFLAALDSQKKAYIDFAKTLSGAAKDQYEDYVLTHKIPYYFKFHVDTAQGMALGALTRIDLDPHGVEELQKQLGKAGVLTPMKKEARALTAPVTKAREEAEKAAGAARRARDRESEVLTDLTVQKQKAPQSKQAALTALIRESQQTLNRLNQALTSAVHVRKGTDKEVFDLDVGLAERGRSRKRRGGRNRKRRVGQAVIDARSSGARS